MNKSFCSNLLGFCALLMVAIFSGCSTPNETTPNNAGKTTAVLVNPDLLQIGDRLKINFSGLPVGQEMTPHEEQINESGDISLPLIGTVKAVGKSLSELQAEIRDA